MPEQRTCSLCLKPAALQSCCVLGKIPPIEWTLDHLMMFLDILKTSEHKWSKFGSLGDLVDAPLSQGGYKEIFKRERLTGKLVIGKQRKTIADTMKRFGIGNVKHRDLICESLFDLSRPIAKVPEDVMLEELNVLVKNSWTHERRPDIQLQALTDFLRISMDPTKHDMLMNLAMAETLMDIVSGPMIDPVIEKALELEQIEINDLKARRKQNELNYDQKKELDRKEFQQAKTWIQCKADFGSLAVTAYCVLQNLSTSTSFKEILAKERFCKILIKQLVLFKEAERNLDFLHKFNRGQFLNLVTTEVSEQQVTILSIILNLSSEAAYKIVLVNCGLSKAVIELASSKYIKDNTPIQLKCLQILSSLSSTNGQTEETLVEQGTLQILTPVLRNGFGETLMLVLATLSCLAFVSSNSKAIIDAGILQPISNILKRGDKQHRSKAIEVVRNLSAGKVDERLIGTVTNDLVRIIDDKEVDSDEKLRCFIALRSLARFEESLQAFYQAGLMERTTSWARGSDSRIRAQAFGIILNVLGNTSVVAMDADEEDEVSDDEEDELQTFSQGAHESTSTTNATSNGTAGPKAPVHRACKVMQRRISPFLRLLTEDEISLLASDCSYLYLPKGSILATEGERVDSLFVVIKGVLRVLLNPAGTRNSQQVVEDKDETSIKNTASGKMHVETGNSPIVGGDATLSKNIVRTGKGAFIEILRLRSGDTACELSFLESRACAATIMALTDSIILDIRAEYLTQLLSKRRELAGLITPGEKAILPVKEQLRKLWNHPTISDEVCEKVNLSRMELSHVRIKMQRLLLKLDSLTLFQRAQENDDLTGVSGRMLIKLGITLLIGGPDTKDNRILEVDEETVLAIKETVDAIRAGKDWHGHRYQVYALLLASRLMVLNDKNKRQFIRSNMIPWILRLVKTSDNDEEVRLATSILLTLSYAMRARWLLRPIMLIWHRFVQQAKDGKNGKPNISHATRTVDLAAPFHLEEDTAGSHLPSFEVELHEAASEGGVQWMQRLLDENGVDPDVRDRFGANAMHFAALSGKMDAISFLMQKGVSVNVPDGNGCTPLSWFLMARQIELGMEPSQWPKRWKEFLDWLRGNGAQAQFVPAFPFSV